MQATSYFKAESHFIFAQQHVKLYRFL